MVKKQPKIIHKELDDDLQESETTVTSQTINNTLHQHDLQSCRTQKVLLLKRSHLEVCLKFDKEYLCKFDIYWNYIH